MNYTLSTTDTEATKRVAAKLAACLTGCEVIELRSDLGGGKTTFVQGLALGLGYDGPVTSPTFTLSQIYQLPRGKELHHYDLYRLTEAGVVGNELSEDIGQPDVLTVIEWAGIAETKLPADRLVVAITPTGETDRELLFTSSGPVSTKILEGLMK